MCVSAHAPACKPRPRQNMKKKKQRARGHMRERKGDPSLGASPNVYIQMFHNMSPLIKN